MSLLDSVAPVARAGTSLTGAVTGMVTGMVTGTVTGGARMTSRIATEAVRAPVRTTKAATELATGAVRQGTAAAGAAPRQALTVARALADAHPRRTRRRVWRSEGHAQIEVRGATGRGPQHRRVTTSVRRALSSLNGVRWAEVNAVTGQVLVAFDEGKVDVGTLLDIVRKVEEAHGTREADFSWDKPVHPADNASVGAALVSLASDYVAFWSAVSGRVLRVPAMPRGVRVTLTLLDMQPQLRRHLSARIGPVSTDVVMALTHSAVSGLSQRPVGPAISSVHHAQVLAEVLARRAVWNSRQAELCCTPEALPDEAPAVGPRPVPLPDGPFESWAAKLGPGTFAGALGVLALTREPRRGADTVLAAVPRAARLGREAFASTAGRLLAQRGVVPLDATAYRRLDRVSAVVLDAAALCTGRPQVLEAEGEHEHVRAVWREVSRLLRDVTMEELAGGQRVERNGSRLERDVRDVAPGALPLVLRQGDRTLGRVVVGPELSPLAEAVVDAARATGARVLLSEHASVAELLPRADEALPPGGSLTEHVRRLQQAGHGVLCLSAADDEALAASDVGVGILGEGVGACWSADLLCGPGLDHAWRVLRVTAEARPLTERVVHMSQSATALGVLLALVGGKRGRSTHALAPVHSSALVGLFHGARTARRATGGPAPAPVVHVAWHALEPADVLCRLAASAEPTGETRRLVAVGKQVASQARKLADRPGPRHALAPARAAFGIPLAVREELQDPLTPVLVLGAAASAIVGSVLDALLVGMVMGGNALVSGAQRYHAEQALQELMVEQEPTAQRLPRTAGTREAAGAAAHDPANGLESLGALSTRTVRASGLVPGDIIALSATDVVPADARLLVASDLEVDESSLTGESVPVHKGVEATPGARLPDRTCMVFDGTSVLAGTAYAVVVATGDATEAARASRAAGAAAPAAGIQARLAEVTRLGLPATGVGGVAIAGIGLLRGLPLRDSIAAGVSVAVAAVPEGLPLVATMAQAGAARRLSRRGVLVRSSRILEALGRVDTVCFDKTGTLTEGRLRVSVLASTDGRLDDDDELAARLLRVASRACPDVAEEDVVGVAHAEDRALLEAAVRSEHDLDRDQWQLRCESPFEATRGYAASLGIDAGHPAVAVKGAPEVLLGLCTSVAGEARDGADDRPMSDELRRTALRTAQDLAEAGLRVLAVAERRTAVPEDGEDLPALVRELTLVGFVGITDPPRDNAAAAVRAMVEAGIRPVMVTGDHPATACAIARQVGLPSDHVVSGDELDGTTEQERVSLVSEANVFARVSPEQKVRIVEAFRAAGRVVMMTGDGTNDAAAIRLADVGIGVGADASAAARSSADLVLPEPDLPRIHDALLEGRAMWHRMQAAVSILVGGNAGEMAFMALGTAVAGRAPINIRQMLLVNLLTDMLPALAVAVAPLRDPGQAHAPVETALGAALARDLAVRGTTTTLGATLAWTAGRYTGRRRRADTMGLAALVGTQLGQTLAVGWRSPLVVATSLCSAASLFAIVETPVVSQLLGCTPIGPFGWVVVTGSSAVGTLAAVAAPRVLPRTGQRTDRVAPRS